MDPPRVFVKLDDRELQDGGDYFEISNCSIVDLIGADHLRGQQVFYQHYRYEEKCQKHCIGL